MVTPPYHGHRHYETTDDSTCCFFILLYPTRLTYPAATQRTGFSRKEKPLLQFCSYCPFLTATTHWTGHGTRRENIHKKWVIAFSFGKIRIGRCYVSNISLQERKLLVLEWNNFTVEYTGIHLIKTYLFFKYILGFLFWKHDIPAVRFISDKLEGTEVNILFTTESNFYFVFMLC